MDEEKMRISRQFHALADPNRLWILELLEQGERNGQGILEAMPIVQSTLSHHMKILGEANLVGQRKVGKWTWYSLDREALAELQQYLDVYTGQTAGESGNRKKQPVDEQSPEGRQKPAEEQPMEGIQKPAEEQPAESKKRPASGESSEGKKQPADGEQPSMGRTKSAAEKKPSDDKKMSEEKRSAEKKKKKKKDKKKKERKKDRKNKE